MTIPFAAAQPRSPQGYVQLPGGYADAIAQAPGAQAQPQAFVPQGSNVMAGMPGFPGGAQPQFAPQFGGQQGQPAASQLPQGMSMPPAGWQGANGLPPQMQPVGQAPAPQPQYQQPQAPQFGQPQPQYQQINPQPQYAQPVQQGAPAGSDLTQRLGGPNVPPELQGRTLGEVLQLNQGLRRLHLESLATGGQPQQFGNRPVQQPTPVTQPQGGQPSAQSWDWTKPRESTAAVVREALAEVVPQIGAMLAPVHAQAVVSAAANAKAQAAAQFGPQQFAQLEGAIHASLQGIDPSALQNPQTWLIAADRVLGEATRRGLIQPQQPQGPGAYPVRQPQPVPNFNSFFSETPNQGGQMMAGPAQISPVHAAMADQMGIPRDVYAAWAGGVASSAQQPFFQGGR